MTRIRPSSRARAARRASRLRPHRAQRLILVQNRHVEHGHHGVADELLHAAAVPLEDRPDQLEIAQAPHATARDRASRRARRAGDAAEENCHRLASGFAAITSPMTSTSRCSCLLSGSRSERRPVASLCEVTALSHVWALAEIECPNWRESTGNESVFGAREGRPFDAQKPCSNAASPVKRTQPTTRLPCRRSWVRIPSSASFFPRARPVDRGPVRRVIGSL